ncbi:MAG: hypothetical protein ACE5EO_10815 [Candidatus Krumholzibacteriia bacterium]
MSKYIKTIGVLLVVLALGGGCVLEDKVVQIVFSDETFVEFHERHESETFTTPLVLDYAQEINDVLVEEDMDRSMIVNASLVSVSYGVTRFSHAHDWEITGAIAIERTDPGGPGSILGPATIVNYDSVSVQGALGEKITADLDPAGVALLNGALQDFIDGQNPILVFTVQNGNVDPNPSATDVLDFDWKAWLSIQVIVEETLEDVPDPF